MVVKKERNVDEPRTFHVSGANVKLQLLSKCGRESRCGGRKRQFNCHIWMSECGR